MNFLFSLEIKLTKVLQLFRVTPVKRWIINLSKFLFSMWGLRKRIKINSNHFKGNRQCFNTSVSPTPGEICDGMNEEQKT